MKSRIIFIVSFVFLVAAFVAFDVKAGYFSYIGWVYELVGAMAIFGMASFKKLDVALVKTVSNYSFSVYLVHFMVIGVFDRIYNLLLPLQVIANLIVIAISALILYACLFIAKIIKLEKLTSLFFGVKNR